MTHPDFIGRIQVRPPLNEAEQDFLLDLLDSDGTLRGTPTGRGDATVPFARLAWEVCHEGCCLEWNGEEDSKWMGESLRVVIDHWLKAGAKAEGHPRFADLTFDHVLSGAVMGRGVGDRATVLVTVTDNVVAGRTVPEPCEVPTLRPLAHRSAKWPDNVIEFRPRRAGGDRASMRGMEELVVRRAGLSPVKGMRHLALDHLDLDEQGPVGDRGFCLIDPARRRVLRTVQHPSLIGVVARSYDDALALTLPGGDQADGPAAPSGETVTCDYWGRQVDLALTDGPHSQLVSEWLGMDVRLARAPRGGVVFAAPITLVATASLQALGNQAEPARFRATLVVETDAPWVEDDWLGRTMTVGDATIRIGGPIPRCAVVDHHPETGEKDTRLLKQLARERPANAAGEPMFGVYATVVAPGRVTR